MIAKVLVNRNIDSLDKEFSYLIPDKMEIKIGSRVIVPFGNGNSKIIGIVTDVISEENLDIKLKPILELLDQEPLIEEHDISIANFIAEKTFSNRIECLKLFLPPMDLKSIKKELFDTKSMNIINESDFEKSYIHEKIKTGEFKYRYFLKNEQSMYTKTILRIKKEANNLSDKQQLAYDLIKDGEYSKKEIISLLNISDSPIKTLLRNGFIEEKIVLKKIKSKYKNKYLKHKLNTTQQYVMDGILNDYKNGNNKFLINGVTGSGKTEVYLQIVEEFLKKDKSALILVPEIGLTPQTVARFKGRFDEDVAIIHSKLTLKERYDQWMRIKNGDIRIVVGARSAIFAPIQNLGIIIIDEEHDNSYISSHTPKYNTIEVAEYIADLKKNFFNFRFCYPKFIKLL